MADISAEKLAQRAFGVNLLDNHQLEVVWGELGTRNVSADEFVSLAVRKEFLTNFQVDRLVDGKRDGYFYGKYKLLYMVGSGTFARVYRAMHTETGRTVAVKVLRQRYSDDLSTRENFLREAKLVMPLRHINIVPIYEVNTERNRPFMVMEFVEGSNLREFVRSRKKLGVMDSLRIMADVAAALEYAMSQGVTHRDLKLSNVLVTGLGRAKLVDFGLAALEDQNNDKEDSFNPRSIDYAGLERCTGVRRNDPRSDIYFAGCMLYHMLVGRAPLYETRDRTKRLSVQRFREVKPINQEEPDVPIHVVQLVNKAMDLKAERRFAKPGELVRDLRNSIRRLEQGDDEAEKNGEATPAQTTLDAAENLGNEGMNRTVMVVESKVELQNVLRDRLKKRGYRVLVMSHPERALSRFEDDDKAADCVLLSAAELGEQALEAFNQFAEDETTKKIPAILLIDQKQRDMVKRAKVAEHRKLLALPLKVRELRIMVRKLLRREEAESK